MNTKSTNKIAIVTIYFISALVVVILAALLVSILGRGLPNVSWHFLTSHSSAFTAGGGISDQLFNSFYLLILSMLISLPIALGSAIYLNEFANQQSEFISIFRSAIEVLSSLPSVVVGLFGFLLFVLKFHFGFSVLSGAVALTFFNLPLLTSSIENSLAAIPNLQREAGLALGLSKWETTGKVILPAAVPSIVTGIVLAAGRVFGEAAALLFTAGQSAPQLNWLNWNPFDSNSPLNPMRPAETLAVHIWKVNSEGTMPDAARISAGASAVLIIMVLIFNLLARYLGSKLYKKMTSGSAR
ncbi:phosphate ABC transporter permease PstA [Oenococcus kitaharae]|uniref:Phosphate transport system permease protein PstA n=1 Tax=Oenococcus kitaharae DSM 17330 TaxID=1045004 RepID=G9WFE2_9LACO|nr:phosphate ABC transporter permease PstA [Oenococcus kitaharae]EHN59099.1 Phosphate transport system permease protein [Oenococcus kitaharae DSM 17330]MCV3297023.1 phosphate ABC transporter permease PstA [Oenococcus kitaharae]OEY82018.1 phosphate ABC transporter permease [Oenococcus kitaharae]OEY82389.1 phosphate ABC transporter permease [Oenococcus kitaharae]OEY82795.1 phosphate ABC transporter permease [Oenococcus kitaharae]